MDTITTTLKREFFAAIVDGSKRVEYREIKPYWTEGEGRSPNSPAIGEAWTNSTVTFTFTPSSAIAEPRFRSGI